MSWEGIHHHDRAGMHMKRRRGNGVGVRSQLAESIVTAVTLAAGTRTGATFKLITPRRGGRDTQPGPPTHLVLHAAASDEGLHSSTSADYLLTTASRSTPRLRSSGILMDESVERLLLAATMHPLEHTREGGGGIQGQRGGTEFDQDVISDP